LAVVVVLVLVLNAEGDVRNYWIERGLNLARVVRRLRMRESEEEGRN